MPSDVKGEERRQATKVATHARRYYDCSSEMVKEFVFEHSSVQNFNCCTCMYMCSAHLQRRSTRSLQTRPKQ